MNQEDRLRHERPLKNIGRIDDPPAQKGADLQENEVDRLRRVYASYRDDERILEQWSEQNAGNRLILQERSDAINEVFRECGQPLMSARILDVGCGSGRVLASLTELGAVPNGLYGIDLLSDRVESARANHPGIHFTQGNAEQLPFDSNFFDMLLSFTVFTSILDDRMAVKVAAEMQRVLKPGGAVIWYDFRFNNPRNPHVRAMSRSRIQALFSGFDIRLRSITLLPPLARSLGSSTPWLYPVLSTVPFLRTHYIGRLTKPSRYIGRMKAWE